MIKRGKHGRSGTQAYVAWKSMVSRCLRKGDERWEGYGGRGIKLHPSWRRFEGFYADMGDPPASGYSLDRKDNNGNYEPGNCRWATKVEQARNKRNSTSLTCMGITRTIAEWAEFTGINYITIYMRMERGWLPQLAVTTPVRVVKSRYSP